MNKQELMENFTMEEIAEMVVKCQSEGKIKNPEIQINCPVCGTLFEFNDGKERFYITVLVDTIHSLEEENQKLKNTSEIKNDEIQKLKQIISNLTESNGRLQEKVDTYTDYLLPRCTKKAKELIDHNRFSEVRIFAIEDEKKCDYGKKSFNISDSEKFNDELEKFLKVDLLQSSIDKICKDIVEQKNNAMAMEFAKVICELLRKNGVYVHCTETRLSENITENSIEEKYGICFDSIDFSEHDKKFTDEIEKLKSRLDRKQTEIDQIDEILNELFGVTHDIAKPAEFERILREKAEGYKTISDFLPEEPIEVASMLISAGGEYERSGLLKAIRGEGKETYNLFDISEIRQIAEHLLVYCNANGQEEE